MAFDIPTLFAVMLFVVTVAGLLLLFAWMQNRGVVALGLWGTSYLLGAAAIFMFGIGNGLADAWSGAYAGAVWSSAHGFMLTGARSFEGRRTPLLCTFAGAILWLAASQFEGFSASPKARIVLLSAIVGGYLIWCAVEVWHARDRDLMSRWPAMVLLVLHGTMFLIRIPLVDLLPFPGGVQPPSPHWIPVGIFAMLFHVFGMAVVLVNMAKERAELHQRKASLVDPLTGIANRRAFFDRGADLLEKVRGGGQGAALLLFDLDRFKEVNDNFGHQFGDLVLARFCEVTRSVLRPQDLFGRIGGEEFGCLLPETPLIEAFAVAERVRGRLASVRLSFDAIPVVATVSVGVAVTSEIAQELGQLFAAADRALYRAKARGRNRVETGRAPLALVEAASAAAG
jgi:diguanylate cyclase (GGDEF)-like protein